MIWKPISYCEDCEALSIKVTQTMVMDLHSIKVVLDEFTDCLETDLGKDQAIGIDMFSYFGRHYPE